MAGGGGDIYYKTFVWLGILRQKWFNLNNFRKTSWVWNSFKNAESIFYFCVEGFKTWVHWADAKRTQSYIDDCRGVSS